VAVGRTASACESRAGVAREGLTVRVSMVVPRTTKSGRRRLDLRSLAAARRARR
jgi:hypothetical protein